MYELEEATAKLAGPGGSRYAAEEPELVITEYNPDYLDYYQIICSREGETAELQKGRDYQVEETGTEDTWKAYRYRIGKENFQKEGIYRVTLYSEDRAKNASSSQGKKKSLEFIVDKTGPGIVIHGVKDRERIAGPGRDLCKWKLRIICRCQGFRGIRRESGLPDFRVQSMADPCGKGLGSGGEYDRDRNCPVSADGADSLFVSWGFWNWEHNCLSSGSSFRTVCPDLDT